MRQEIIFILTVFSLLLLLIVTNMTQPEMIQIKIEKIQYYENLCKIYFDGGKEILIFGGQIFNIKTGDMILIETKLDGKNLIGQKIIKI
jgi:hypothetical protein